MGILYSVKFQIFHEEIFEDDNEIVSNDDKHYLERIQEILDIVDTKRKKNLGIQTQLTRHVAVLKYHRSHQEKEFPVNYNLVFFLPSQSTC